MGGVKASLLKPNTMPEFKSTEQLRAEALLEKKDKLRDKFAAAALQSLIHQFEVCENQSAAAAKAAYKLADAMLQEKLNNPLK